MKLLITTIFIISCCFSRAQSGDQYKHSVDSLLKIKSTGEVISFLQEELKTKPNDESLLRWIGYLYVSDGQLDLGEKYYKNALTLNPACSRCYTNLGRIAAIRKDFQKALELLNKSLLIEPSDATTYQIRASVKSSSNDLVGALADYDKAVVLEPKRADCYIDRANFSVGQQNFSSAISDLGKAIQLAPEYYLPYYRRARVYFDISKHNEALRDINTAIRLDSSLAELYVGRAALYSYYNEHAKALADYEKAIALDPDDYFNYYTRAQEKYILEDMDGFCGDVHVSHDLISKKDPANPFKKELEHAMGIYCDPAKASYYYQRGVASYNLQKFSQAVDIYTKGIQQFPENAMLLSFRGNAYFIQMDFANALQDYYAAIKYKENIYSEYEINRTVGDQKEVNTQQYVNAFIANTYLNIAQSKLALGQYKEALEAINRGIEMAPQMKEYGLENYYNVRGNIYLVIQDNQSAIKDFNKCMELNPGYAPAYANRAVAKINGSGQVQLAYHGVWISNVNQTLFVHWSLSPKTKVKKISPELSAALLDLNKATDLENAAPFAFYIRGLLNKITGQGDPCADFVMAGKLGFPVGKELIEDCRK